jgi:hypothetical protein
MTNMEKCVAAAAALTLAACGFASAAEKSDPAPRRLMISVSQDIAADGMRRGADVSAGPQVRIYDSRSSESRNVTQTVQALEGRAALIQAGQSRAAPERRVTRSMVGGRVVEHTIDGVEYRSANTGFLVLPRLSGDRVTLEVSAQRESFVPNTSGGVDTQRVVTTVSGRLGEWIEVAGSSEERSSDRAVIRGSAGGTRSEARTVFLKVDELR